MFYHSHTENKNLKQKRKPNFDQDNPTLKSHWDIEIAYQDPTDFWLANLNWWVERKKFTFHRHSLIHHLHAFHIFKFIYTFFLFVIFFQILRTFTILYTTLIKQAISSHLRFTLREDSFHFSLILETKILRGSPVFIEKFKLFLHT